MLSHFYIFDQLAGCGAGDGWTETYFRKCMKYVKTPIATWDAAQAKCKAEGGELATFEDQEQVDYVTDVRKRFPGEHCAET